MSNFKYAYVSYVGTSERDIVPIENIKHFNAEKHDSRTKYKIKWNNNYYYASVVFFGETEEEVRDKAESARPKVISDNLLVSNSESEEPQRNHKKRHNDDSAQTALLNKKLKQLESKHGNNEVEPLVSATTTIATTPTSNLRLENTASTSAGVTSITAASVAPVLSLNIGRTSKDVVSKSIGHSKRLFPSEEVTKLKLELEKSKAHNTNLQQQLEDVQKLNIELQKNVIRVVGEMQVELARLTNREIMPKEDEHVGYPAVGFIKQSDNSIHIGRDVWLKSEIYDTILFTSTTPSLFVKQMALAVFGGRTLKQSTVTGRISNRKINKADCPPPRPKLDSVKLMAIEDIFRHWLTTNRKMDSVQVNAYVVKMPTYITKKIAQMNAVKKMQLIEPHESDSENHIDLENEVAVLDESKMSAAAASSDSGEEDCT